MRRYKITKVVGVNDEEKFNGIAYYHEATLRVAGVMIVQVRLRGKTIYYRSLTLCRDEQVLPLVLKWVNLWNTAFLSRKRNRGRFSSSSKRNSAKSAKRRVYRITIKRNHQSYDGLSRIKGFDRQIVCLMNRKALVFIRLRGKTCHYHIVRGEGWLDAHRSVAQIIGAHNEEVWGKKRRTVRHAA